MGPLCRTTLSCFSNEIFCALQRLNNRYRSLFPADLGQVLKVADHELKMQQKQVYMASSPCLHYTEHQRKDMFDLFENNTQLWPKKNSRPTWNRPTSPIKAQQLGKISTAGCGLRCSCRISCKIRCCRWGFGEPDGAGAASRMASWRRSSQKSLGSKPCVPAKK